MKTSVKLLSWFLCLLMLVPLALSCGQNGTDTPDTTAAQADTASPETTDSKYDEKGYEKDDLPEKMDFKGVTLVTLYGSDYQMTEYFAEGNTGDFIADAIYSRNMQTEQRLGVTLEFVGFPGGDKKQDGFLQKAMTDAQSGPNSEYDMYAGYSRTIPLIQLEGLCLNLLDTPYINIDKPWWPQAVLDELVIKNQLYFCTGDISSNLLWMMSALFFNTQMWEDSNFGTDPYALVDANEWTLDKFIEFIKDFYKDDGNGKVDKNDIFGLAAYNTCLDAFQNASGIISLDKDADGNLKFADDYKGSKMADLVAKCGTFFSVNSVHHSSTSADEKGIFIDGHSLFLSDALYVVKGKDNGNAIKIELDYGLVPFPKYTKDQEHFVTNLRYPFNVYAISTMSDQADASSAALECLASYSYRLVTPMIFEGAMKTRYSADNKTSQMYDILRETVCFDLGRIYGYALGNYYTKFRNTAIAGGQGWTGAFKAIESMTIPLIDKINESYSK